MSKRKSSNPAKSDTRAAKIVAYYRVSTRKQEVSGLGLEAQQAAVAEYASRNKARILAEYTEIETGRNSQRPKLQEAIAHARLSKATLLVAKLDRLSRNVLFTSTLLEAGIDFVACDNPHANRLTIQLLAVMAENESFATSRRTKEALAAAKAKGKLLGSARPGHWKGRENLRGWKKGNENSAKVRTRKVMDAYAFLLPKMRELESKYQAEGGPIYEQIATWLNDNGHQTTYGKPFTATAVWRILRRAEKLKIA